MVYFLLEDGNTGLLYKMLNKYIEYRNNILVRDCKIIALNGIKNIYKYVRDLKIKDDDLYLIFMDYVYDNNVVMTYYKRIRTIISKYPRNYMIFEMLSFEFLVLGSPFMRGCFKPYNDKHMIDYKMCLNYTDLLLSTVNNEISWYRNNELLEYMLSRLNISKPDIEISDTGEFIFKHFEKTTVISIERVAYQILNNITYYTMFKYEKGRFKKCWYDDCCVMGSIIGKKCTIYSSSYSSKYKISRFFKDCGIYDFINKAYRRYKQIRKISGGNKNEKI